MALRIKICGITRLSDAELAVEAGADALGFMFYERSRRRLSWDAAEVLLREVSNMVDRVGVFVDPTSDVVERALDLGVDQLQLHGNESPDFCNRFSVGAIKALRVRDRSSIDELPAYLTVPTWLLDSYVPGEAGGTGAVFSWELALEAKRFGHRFFLAGGLTPDNVAEAVRQVQPYGVDVSSGVEAEPGKKDPGRLKAFIQAAREAERALSAGS